MSKSSTDQMCVSLKGPQTEAQLRNLYSRAAVYAATARYEPLEWSRWKPRSHAAR